MKTSPSDWLCWDQSEPLPFKGGVSFTVRTTKPLSCTNEDGLPLAFGNGEQEISVTGDGEITFKCPSVVWLRPSTRVQERLQRSTEVFTSLDRPAPMSPEMIAIQRMMRKNEIDRERDRQEMEKRFVNRSKPESRTESAKASSPASAEKAEPVGENTERSAEPSEKPASVAASSDASSDRVSVESAGGD